MIQNLQKPGRYKKKFFVLAIFLFLFSVQTNAQEIKRQTISSVGVNVLTDFPLSLQTVGQPYSSLTYYDNEVSYLPGFQQPTLVINESLPDTYVLDLALYPNPAVVSATINSPEPIKNAFIKVVDFSGRIVFSEKLAKLTNYSLNCENWKSGIYILSISGEEILSYTTKLIINK